MLVHFKNIIFFLVYSMLYLTPSTQAFAQTVELNKTKLERLKATINKFKIPSRLEKKALLLKKHVNSEQYLSQQKKYEAQIKNILNIESPEDINKKNNEDQKTNPLHSLILFISESMPIETLRRYAKDIEKHGGLMVLRGVVGNDDSKLLPTIKFMENVLKKDKYCSGFQCKFLKTNVTIDPRLFMLYNIKQIPALVFAKNMSMINYINQNNENSMPALTKFIVYGDASLNFMAQELARISKDDDIQHSLRLTLNNQ